MDPATEFTGGQPVAADSLYGIIPTSLMGGNRMIDLDFGPDGALYVADYGGSNFAISNANTASGASPTSAAPTPRVPTRRSPRTRIRPRATFAFNIGKSGGVSYTWDFSDGGTSTSANAAYTFTRAGNGGPTTATLTVTYADGATASKTIEVDDADGRAARGQRARAEAARPVAGDDDELRRVHAGRRGTPTTRPRRPTSSRR